MAVWGRASKPAGDPPAPAAQRDVDPALRAIERVIRKFLAAYHPAGRDGINRLAASRNLWREVSSLTMLELVSFVEHRFAITVRPIDFAPQNFSTVAAIARFVAARRPPAPAPAPAATDP